MAARATRANGQPAVGCYIRNDGAGKYEAAVIDVTRGDDKIAAVTALIESKLFERFGPPAVVQA